MRSRLLQRYQPMGFAVGDRVQVAESGLSGSGATGTIVDLVGAIAVVLRDGEPRLASAELVIPIELLEHLADQFPNPAHQPPSDLPPPFWWRSPAKPL